MHELYVGFALVLGAAFLVWRARQKPLARLMPEALCVVRVTESEVTCEWPEGPTRAIALSDVTSIRIRTTDDGPWGTDVLWGFHGPTGEPVVIVPGGATGEQDMLRELSKLPGWNDSAVIEAMGCTSNRMFVAWERATSD